MDIKPMTEKSHKKPIIPIQTHKPMTDKVPNKPIQEILKPKSLSDLVADIEIESDSEEFIWRRNRRRRRRNGVRSDARQP